MPCRRESHPVILPKKCNISERVAPWSHQCVGHRARGLTSEKVECGSSVQIQCFGIWFASVLHAADQGENWGFRKWQTYQVEDAWK